MIIQHIIMSSEAQSWVAIDIQEPLAINTLPFNSKLKNIFWKITELFILQIDGFIKECDFSMVVREHLLEFTENEQILDETVGEICKIFHSIKYPKIGTVFNKTDDYILRTVNEELKEQKRKIIFQFSGKHTLPNYTDILAVSDFSLANRIELCMLAVLNEIGFGEFSRNIKNEVRRIKHTINYDLPIYRKCINDVMEHTIYLTNRTYGVLYKIFYHKIITNFVDKL